MGIFSNEPLYRDSLSSPHNPYRSVDSEILCLYELHVLLQYNVLFISKSIHNVLRQPIFHVLMGYDNFGNFQS
jgi:hypothetical protein